MNRLKCLQLGLLLPLAFFVPASCSGGDSNHAVTSGGAGSTTGSSTGATPCERACANYARYCEDPDCAIVCRVVSSIYDVPLCPEESGAYFDCVAALPQSGLVCETDGGTASSSLRPTLVGGNFADKTCYATNDAFMMCHQTKGADCAAQPVFDESCAITDSAHPHFQFCKLDVAQPATCVPFDSILPGRFCCE